MSAFKVGDFVVLLSSWSDHDCKIGNSARCFSFIEGMESFINQIGLVIGDSTSDSLITCSQLSVRFYEFNDAAYICPKAVREATDEEARIAKFIYRLKGEVPIGNKKR